MHGLVTAFRTLTAVPVPGRDADDPAAALPWFPVVGAAVGGSVWAVAAAHRALSVSWDQGTALLLLALPVLITRGLHADGLADWADSLGILGDRNRALEVMKDSRTGVFGVLALMLGSLARWAAFLRMLATGVPLAVFPLPFILSRWVQVELAVGLPYARSSGGTAASFVSGARTRHRVLALAPALLLAGGLAGAAGVGLMAIAWIMQRIFARHCRRRYGGVTGDLLGACSEIVETALLWMLAEWTGCVGGGWATGAS